MNFYVKRAKQTKYMSKNYFLHFTAAVIISVLISCSGDPQNKEIPVTANDTTAIRDSVKPVVTAKVEMVISDIPFPFEMLENLHTSGVDYDQKVMNPVSNTTKYNQYNSKALNLGIYGADLAYVVTYEQFQQIGAYIKNAKKLAEDLNIPFAFNQNMMDRYSKFKDNKDSLTRIVYDSYSQVDKTLKGDERVGIAALVVTGSWLEGLHLSTQTFVDAEKTKENAGLYKTISAQKKSLAIVVKLLDEYKQDPYIAKLIVDLDDIVSSYSSATSNVVLNEQELIVIDKKVDKLRDRIVEGL
ncbi:MAG: hypothetical protein JWP12_3977 [Bacteroidetes bacterium]|nr:hypothetical protein [Bacteroidota bacterium]